MEIGMLDLVHRIGECIYMCNLCIKGCLEEPDVAMMRDCIRLDKACIGACSYALTTAFDGSRWQKDALKHCAHVCEACGKECARYPQDHCQRCAEACKACAKACSAMA